MQTQFPIKTKLLPLGIRSICHSFLPFRSLLLSISNLSHRDRLILLHSDILDQPRVFKSTFCSYSSKFYDFDFSKDKNSNYALKLANIIEITLKDKRYVYADEEESGSGTAAVKRLLLEEGRGKAVHVVFVGYAANWVKVMDWTDRIQKVQFRGKRWDDFGKIKF